jgi:anti-sigma B factor antagonist
MPAEFSITVVPDRAEVSVVPAGELDLSSCPALEHEVRQLRAAGFDRLVVDLRRVSFIDSAALRALLGFRGDAEREGHGFAVVPGPPNVQRIFEITGTQELFDWRRPSVPARVGDAATRPPRTSDLGATPRAMRSVRHLR